METTGWRTCRYPSVIFVILLAAACGTSPSQPSGTLPAPTLSAGNYTFKLDPGAPQGTPNFCFSDGTGGLTSAALPVSVTQNSNGWSVRPTAEVDRGLVVSLQVAGATLEGTANGAAIEGPTLVVFGTAGSAPEQVRLSGTMVSANTVMGYTTGRLEFSMNGASSGCTSYQWRLQPR